MRVLVAFGSKRGGTEGLAAMIGAALCDLPVWLVGSGPLDESAALTDTAPTKQVRAATSRSAADSRQMRHFPSSKPRTPDRHPV